MVNWELEINLKDHKMIIIMTDSGLLGFGTLPCRNDGTSTRGFSHHKLGTGEIYYLVIFIDQQMDTGD